jgi:hypothetical protein
VSMQDPGYELPRITIPRNRVNKGDEKGRGCYTPAPLFGGCAELTLRLGFLAVYSLGFFLMSTSAEASPPRPSVTLSVILCSPAASVSGRTS